MCILVYILLPHKPVFKNSKIPLSINNQQKLSVLISVPQFTQSVCQTLPYICYLLVQRKSRGIASCTPNMHKCTRICLIIFLSSSIGDTNFWLFSMNSQWVFMLKCQVSERQKIKLYMFYMIQSKPLKIQKYKPIKIPSKNSEQLILDCD